MTERIFMQYDEQGNELDRIVAESLEWCMTHLGPNWCEITDLVDTRGVARFDHQTNAVYNAYDPVTFAGIPRSVRIYSLWAIRDVARNGEHLSTKHASDEYEVVAPVLNSDTRNAIQTALEEDQKRTKRDIMNHRVVLDLAPYAVVMWTETKPESLTGLASSMAHPHCAAHNLHEMLCLIWEWAWAHNELNNNEPIAVLASKVMADLNPSDDVIAEFDAMNHMAIRRFLAGDEEARLPHYFDEMPSLSMIMWLNDLTARFAPRQANQPFRVAV